VQIDIALIEVSNVENSK